MAEDFTGAFIVGRIRIKDAAKWAVYRDAVPATLVPHRGTLVVRGHDGRALAGRADDTDVVVIRFPSMDAVDDWYRSPSYRALIPLRDEAGDVTIVAYRV